MTTHDMQPEASGAGSGDDRYSADPAYAQRQPGYEQQQPGFDQQRGFAQQQPDFEQQPGYDQQHGLGHQHGQDFGRDDDSRQGEATAALDDRQETRGVDSSRQDLESTRSAGADGQTLFTDSDHSDLRARWTEVQSAFVDDPRECVQKADRLVTDLVEKVTAGFGEARSRLEEQWSRGEEVSTEDLRVALRRYRDFFERLLTV